MITKRQYKLLQFFLIKPLFIGYGISNLAEVSDNAMPLCALLGFILSIFFIKFINKINKLKKDLTLLEYIGKKIDSVIIRIIILSILLSILITLIISTTTLVNSFYLIYTPINVITIAILLLIYYVLKKGTIPLLRALEIIFPVSITLYLLRTFSYLPMIDLNNLKPYLNTDLKGIIQGTLIFFTYTSAPTLILLNFKDSEIDNKITGFMTGAITEIITITLITLVIGFPLAGIFRFPEYMIIKRINILNFIVNVENIFSVFFIIDSIILIIFIINYISDIIKSFTNNKIIVKNFNALFLITLGYIFINHIFKSYSTILYIYNYVYIIILILLTIFTILIIKKIKELTKVPPQDQSY